MAAPQIAGMPPGLRLNDGYTVRFTALDATTGAVVAGVKITSAALQVNNLGGGAAEALTHGPFLLVPGTGA